MIADLPRRWRREADQRDQLALVRLDEDRSEAAQRLQASAAAFRDCADDLTEEMGGAMLYDVTTDDSDDHPD